MTGVLRSSEAFVDTLRALMERSRDVDLHSRIWDFREGKISRVELYRDPSFRREMTAWYAESLAALADEGLTPERVRARLTELEAEGRLERPGSA
ncbi:MAG: hypothetical protein ACXWXO_17025 [Nocardioides sp.]